MKQIEITQKTRLLDNKGNIAKPGYAKKLLWDYDRSHIKASKWRIKEWDYYLICNDEVGVALTMDDNGYMGLMSLSLLDFKNKIERTVSPMQWFVFGKRNFPKTSKEGIVEYKDKECHFRFETKDGKRKLYAYMNNFYNNQPAEVYFDVLDEPEESIVIATPFEKEAHFYYNQKINAMKTKGWIKYAGKTVEMSEENTLTTLDWGRGVWTYHNTWYWGSGSGYVDGHAFGFNIGYGFGDTSNATENMLFYDGKAHKLEHVTFNIPMKDGKEDYLKPWTFTSSDSRFEIDFTPILNRRSCTDVKLIKSDQNQVFGYFNGKAALDDGTIIELKDFLGFAEKVENKW